MFDNPMEGDESVLARDVIRRAMMIRYGLHEYIYTLFHRASTEGEIPIKPIFFNHPHDEMAFQNIHNNVMLGNAIKASPDTEIFGPSTYYFPEDVDWCPIWGAINSDCIRGGTSLETEVPDMELLLHLGAGHMIPQQLSKEEDLMKREDIRSLDDLQNEYTDIALFINNNNIAEGVVRFDDGEGIDFTLYDEIKFHSQRLNPFLGPATLNITFEVTQQTNPGPMTNSQMLGNIIIHDARSISMSSAEGHLKERNGKIYALSVQYNSDLDVSWVSYGTIENIAIRDIEEIFLEVV